MKGKNNALAHRLKPAARRGAGAAAAGTIVSYGGGAGMSTVQTRVYRYKYCM